MDETEAWIRAHAEVTGPIETTHEQAWSTVRRVPTAEGVWWWKAPDGSAEAPLTAFLASLAPDAVTPVVAIDPERGWLLLRDAGTRLREILERDPDLSHWEPALRTVAELQRAAAPHVDEMLAMGVPDRRLERLPDLIEDLLGRDEFLMLDEDEGLTRRPTRRARGAGPRDPHDVRGARRGRDRSERPARRPQRRQRLRRRRGVPDRGLGRRLHLAPLPRAHGGAAGDVLEARPDARRAGGAAAARRVPGAVRRGPRRAGASGRPRLPHRHPRPGVRVDDLRGAASPQERGDDLESVPYGLRKFLEDGPVGDWS